MENEKRLIEIPSDGIICIPIMEGDTTVGERRVDLSWYPTVDAVEVVHGRWKEGNVIHKYGCSCCWARQDTISPYCPNCGAKMDGEDNGVR